MANTNWRNVATSMGAILTGLGGAWLVTWGSIVAATDPPQSKPFWIAATYVATAAFVIGLLLLIAGERTRRDTPQDSTGKHDARSENADQSTSSSFARGTITWTSPDPATKDGWAVVTAGIRRYDRMAVRINLTVPAGQRNPLFIYIDVRDPDGQVSRTNGKSVSLYPDDFTSADGHFPLVLERLAPGIYRVHVRAKSHEASSSEAVASTAFEVQPDGAVNSAITP